MPEAPIKVLLVEDNPGDARLVRLALATSRAVRFEVRLVASMTEALKVIATDSFDIVLLDLSLPDCPSRETVDRVSAATARTPIVVLTGLDDEDYSRELVKFGAQDYLVKGQFDNRLLARSLTYAIERKRIEHELATARDGALEASKLKSAFLATMSHEIRTPMNAITGMTEMLLGTELDAEQREFASTVLSSGLSLLAIINDILDFSKVSSSKLTLRESEFRPTAEIESVIGLFADRVQGPELRLESLIDGDMPVKVLGDSGRLVQVLTNLVGNAVKFTEHGEVAVLARRESETADEVVLHFTINDTGPGISSDSLGRLFDPFYQVDSSTTRRHGGTGLGLAISAPIVELMGGTLKVESVVGHGSSFSFAARFRKLPGVCETEADACARLRGKRVLVVDANSAAAQWICRQISSMGLECETALTSAEALEILFRSHATPSRFDSALIDLDSGALNGIELGRAIHADPRLREMRLIALHKFGHRPDYPALEAAGFHTSTSKPIRQSRLFDCLARAVALEYSDSDLSAQISDSPSKRSISALPSRHQLSSTVVAETGSRVRILSVEDHPVNQRVVLKMLERLGYQGEGVSNGREAVEAVRKHDYDIILMDCQMPEMDGYAATRAIRTEFRGTRGKVIIGVTANALNDDRQKCLDAGMDGYLSKPLLMEALAATLARWLAVSGGDNSKRVAAPSGAPDVSAIDMRAIAEFANRDEAGEDFIANIIAVFLADMGERVGAAGLQVSAHDNAGLAATAHAIKGSSGHFGAAHLMKLCAAIEDQVRKGKTDGIDAAVNSMIAEMERVRAALTAYHYTSPAS
ncbi:MAG TPA: response regulator [Methylomirabilota bacterium]|nr:response regulator [Methylomirabilota bacterium]